MAEDREAGVDFDCPFTLLTLKDQGYTVEVFCGRLREAERLLDVATDNAAARGVQAVYLYGPTGFVNRVTL